MGDKVALESMIGDAREAPAWAALVEAVEDDGKEADDGEDLGQKLFLKILDVSGTEEPALSLRRKYADADIVSSREVSGFESASFDVVVMGFGIALVQNQKDFIDEVSRVLKPKGLFLCVYWTKHVYTELCEELLEKVGQKQKLPDLVRCADHSPLIDDMCRAGFAEIDITKGGYAQKFHTFDALLQEATRPLHHLLKEEKQQENIKRALEDIVVDRFKEDTYFIVRGTTFALARAKKEQGRHDEEEKNPPPPSLSSSSSPPKKQQQQPEEEVKSNRRGEKDESSSLQSEERKPQKTAVAVEKKKRKKKAVPPAPPPADEDPRASSSLSSRGKEVEL